MSRLLQPQFLTCEVGWSLLLTCPERSKASLERTLHGADATFISLSWPRIVVLSNRGMHGLGASLLPALAGLCGCKCEERSQSVGM